MDEHEIARPRIDPNTTPFWETESFRRYGLADDPGEDSLEGLYTKAVIREQGFDGLPHVVIRRRLDAYVSAGETQLFRGVTDAWYAEQIRIGEFFVGRGGEIDGMYAAAGPHALVVARQYAARGNGVVVRMTLRREARVIMWNDLEERANTGYRAASGPLSDVIRSLYHDPGRLAAYLGYDAVHVVEYPAIDNFVVFNRSALRVQKEDMR